MASHPSAVGAELAIRARRAAFNRAIAEGDAGAIGPILARDCVMITGTDSAIIAGRLAQVKVWRREFCHGARLVYTRTSQSVALSPVEPIAMEQGYWDGRPNDGAPVAEPTTRGIYSAKWRLMDGNWVIEVEVFVTLG